MHLHKSLKTIIFIVLLFVFAAQAQQTNPVEKQVSNPMTDTPNVNPVAPEQDIKAPPRKPATDGGQPAGDDEVAVDYGRVTVEGKEGNRVSVYSENVDVHYGIYRLQADKITVYEAEGRMIAEGSVVFDQGEDQRITGSKGEFNYKTKLGYFVDSTGFTNQTNDGTVIYFTADRVERVSLTEVVVTKGQFTACEDNIPKWSFTADEAVIKADDRVKLKNAKFRIKNVPILPIPFASIPIKKRDRASGFLTPTASFSGNKGFRLSTAYYKTLGRSADVTFRGDLYASRGFGYGLDLRTRANSRSYFNFGFYVVQDRILGQKVDADHPDQGGSLIYADGVQYFPNGFTAVANVRLTSNLAFRQVFSDGIQQVISPIEVSQAYVNKSWGDYTLNILARSQVISIPNVRVKTRNLPSVEFEKRPSRLSFWKPAYFSFKTSIEGVSRREDVDDLAAYRAATGGDPIVTPAVNQRFDVHPQISVPFYTKYLNITATAGLRVNYYSNSLNALRQVVGRDIIRKYGEFELDLRPVALAKNYFDEEGKFRFRHVIEPFLTYRYINGVNNVNRIIRFDYTDTQSDTNEIEYGATNRLYTRKYTQAVTEEAQKRLLEEDNQAKKDSLSVQPYEIFSLTVRGKYFFDKNFGGAL
ncbi:MAG: LPS assembly protein LptD, partial [Pyrinomonadaceae bacterium]